MRAPARRRGTILPEPVTRPPTPSEQMSAAVRAAAGRALRVSRPDDNDAGK